jgi:hypothetical protein
MVVWPKHPSNATLQKYAYIKAPESLSSSWSIVEEEVGGGGDGDMADDDDGEDAISTKAFNYGLESFQSIYGGQCSYEYNPSLFYLAVLQRPSEVSSSSKASFLFDETCVTQCCEYRVSSLYDQSSSTSSNVWRETNQSLTLYQLVSDVYTLHLRYCDYTSMRSTEVSWRVELNLPLIIHTPLVVPNVALGVSAEESSFPLGINSGHALVEVGANRLACRFFYFVLQKGVEIVDGLKHYENITNQSATLPEFVVPSSSLTLDNADVSSWTEALGETYDEDDEVAQSAHMNNLSWVQLSVHHPTSSSSSPSATNKYDFLQLKVFVIAMDGLGLISWPHEVASFEVDQRMPRTLILSAPQQPIATSTASFFNFGCGLNVNEYDGVSIVPLSFMAYNSTPPRLPFQDDDDDDDGHAVISTTTTTTTTTVSSSDCDCTRTVIQPNCDCRCSYEYRLDGFAGWIPTTNPVTLYNIDEGSHVLLVRSKRKDTGVTDSYPVSFEWSIELEAPKLELVTVPQVWIREIYVCVIKSPPPPRLVLSLSLSSLPCLFLCG